MNVGVLVFHQLVTKLLGSRSLCCYYFVVPHSTNETGLLYSEGELKFSAT